MRMREGYAPTLREIPAEAEVTSHQLSLRAGLIRRSAAGIYTYLPLGFRVLKKIQQIIREELDRVGCQELMLPIVQPAELWHQSGRWDTYGDEMFRVKDRHGRSFSLGPTHEEIITFLVKSDVNSYRQLPITLYQIQNKYRDEIRPRFGVIRGREFIMKDAYSFDRDEAALDDTYQKMYHAYERIFEKCGLQTRAVEADPGAIGGNSTHEFMVLADVGEDVIAFCQACDFAANVEKADAVPAPWPTSESNEIRRVETPGVRTIDELAQFLEVEPQRMIKTLLYMAGDRPVAALIRGDRDVNEVKLARALGVDEVQLADPATIESLTGAPVGYAGPVGLDENIDVIADREIEGAIDAVTGANAADTHLVHVDWKRDFRVQQVADIRTVQAGDACPKCGGELHQATGIEVGQVFKLGTKYSSVFGGHFKDEDGQERPYVMGCYGIGVSRTMAAIIEQHNDENGICWPVSVAPYHVIIIPIRPNDDEQKRVADQLYEQLWEAGVETVLDDRQERPGVKFNDADLIGYPLRITIGPKSLAEGCVELKWRRMGEEETIGIEDVVQHVVMKLGLGQHLARAN